LEVRSVLTHQVLKDILSIVAFFSVRSQTNLVWWNPHSAAVCIFAADQSFTALQQNAGQSGTDNLRPSAAVHPAQFQ
jgi:hypothetical protein